MGRRAILVIPGEPSCETRDADCDPGSRLVATLRPGWQYRRRCGL